MQLSERNAEILRLHEAGHGPTAIGRQLGISPERARQIIERADRREKARAELVARFGEKPNIAALPDDTPIEVLRLCPGKTRAWDTRVHNLTWASPKPVQTLGDLRKATDSQLRRDSRVGQGLLRELRRFCPSSDPTAATLTNYRNAFADARAALRMIREVVEQHAPPGSVPSEEYVEPPFTKEAEALVKGILAIVAAKG
jgi:hypothetical protein